MSKTAIVTGAGSGIGRACALGLLADGWNVALVGRRADALQETIVQAGEAGSRMLALPCNVGDPAAVAAAFDSVVARFGRLDLLFNNAGSGMPSKTATCAEKFDCECLHGWDRVV